MPSNVKSGLVVEKDDAVRSGATFESLARFFELDLRDLLPEPPAAIFKSGTLPTEFLAGFAER